MRLSYDEEGDVLEVVFDEQAMNARKKALRLRQGVVLYVSADTLKPVQFTLVSYRALSAFPVIDFDGWRKLAESDKKELLPILASPSVSAFLKLDPDSGNGHLASPDMLKILPAAA